MAYYFITCRSLTYAQRTAKVLERGGVTSYLARTPKSIAREGCGHGVKLAERHLEQAITLLKRADLSPSHLYFSNGDQNFQEVIF